MLFSTLPESPFCMLTNKTETKLTNTKLNYKSQLHKSQLMIDHDHMLETITVYYKQWILKMDH